MDPNTPPTIRTFTDFESRQSRMMVRTMVPARVEAYDPVTQRCAIQILTQTLYRNERGRERVIPIPVLGNVPVAWPSGDGGYIHTGLKVGDQGLALICDRSISEWKRDGEQYTPYLPNVHNFADACFLPGVRPSTQPLSPSPSSVGTTIEGEKIRMGAGASRGIARIDDDVRIDPQLQTLLNQMLTTISALNAKLTAVGAATAAIGAAAANPDPVSQQAAFVAAAPGATTAAGLTTPPVTAPVPPLSGQIDTASQKSETE